MNLVDKFKKNDFLISKYVFVFYESVGIKLKKKKKKEREKK